MNGKLLFFCLLASLLCLGCKKDKNNTTTLNVNFDFNVDGQAFVPDSRRYVNAAGNHYEVNEIMFFISDITLFKSDGNKISIDSIHYVDYDILSTLSWECRLVPKGDYDGISFTFGISPEKNVSNAFVNPPECDMSWPNVLGGGYHYMKINGKWEASNGSVKPFNLHTGRGQIYDGEGNITKYVDNQFTVTVSQHFVAEEGICLSMNINNWFSNPFLFDWNVWGGSIMQNQEAQERIKANGCDVFSIK